MILNFIKILQDLRAFLKNCLFNKLLNERVFKIFCHILKKLYEIQLTKKNLVHDMFYDQR